MSLNFEKKDLDSTLFGDIGACGVGVGCGGWDLVVVGGGEIPRVINAGGASTGLIIGVVVGVNVGVDITVVVVSVRDGSVLVVELLSLKSGSTVEGLAWE